MYLIAKYGSNEKMELKMYVYIYATLPLRSGCNTNSVFLRGVQLVLILSIPSLRLVT